MGHPVYCFGGVLRRLRNDAGLTVLAAAEATGYGNYERWESGQTQAGGQYLGSIGEAFGVADDLHLLVYAWLVDRLSPQPGAPDLRLERADLDRLLRDTPDVTIDLRDDAPLVLVPGRHVDAALFALAARYGEHGTVTLSAVERAPLPSAATATPALVHLYGDAVAEATAAAGRALIARGIDGGVESLVANLAPLLAEPSTYERLAEALEGIDRTTATPTVAFAASTSDDARRFAALLPRLRDQMRELLVAADRPATDDDVEALTRKVLAGKTLAVLRLVVRAGRQGHLPPTDPSLTAELVAMRARLGQGWVDAVAQETVVELRSASAADAYEVLETLRRRRSA